MTRVKQKQPADVNASRLLYYVMILILFFHGFKTKTFPGI